MDLTRTQRLTAGTARSPHQKPRAAQRLSRLHPLQLPRQHQRRQLQPRRDSVTPAGVLLAVLAYEPSVETLAALQHALCRAEKHNANLLAATCSTVKRWCRISETTTCSGLDTPIYTNPAVGIRCMFHCVRPHAEHRTFQLPFQRIGMNAAQKRWRVWRRLNVCQVRVSLEWDGSAADTAARFTLARCHADGLQRVVAVGLDAQ